MRKKSGVKPKFAVVLALAIVLVLIWYGYKADWFKNTNDDSVAATSQAVNTLSVSQLQAILASLQAQLNALIAQLNQLQQQENNSKPIIKPIESIKSSITLITPTDKEKVIANKPYKITWRSKNMPSDAKIEIRLSSYESESSSGLNKVLATSLNDGVEEVNFDVNSPAGSYASGLFVNLFAYVDGRRVAADGNDYSFDIVAESVPSLKSSLKVTVLKGGIYCIKAPCEFPLAGATVALYDQNKVLVGNQVVGADGLATFTGLNPGTYTAISRATGYVNTTNTIGVLAGQSVSIKTILMISPAPTSQLKASSELASVLQSLQRVLGTLSPALGH